MSATLRLTSLGLGLAVCACGARADDQLRRDAASRQSQPAVSALAASPGTPSPGAPSPGAPSPVAPTPTAPSGVTSSLPASSAPSLPEPSSSGVTHLQPPPAPEPPEPPSAQLPADAGAPAQNACFEYLGDWITCENAGWPNVEHTDATDLESCMQICEQRADCTAVTDYFWLGRPDLGCWLYTSTCDSPASGPWQEEDGGRQYRKTCARDD